MPFSPCSRSLLFAIFHLHPDTVLIWTTIFILQHGNYCVKSKSICSIALLDSLWPKRRVLFAIAILSLRNRVRLLPFSPCLRSSLSPQARQPIHQIVYRSSFFLRYVRARRDPTLNRQLSRPICPATSKSSCTLVNIHAQKGRNNRIKIPNSSVAKTTR